MKKQVFENCLNCKLCVPAETVLYPPGRISEEYILEVKHYCTYFVTWKDGCREEFREVSPAGIPEWCELDEEL